MSSKKSDQTPSNEEVIEELTKDLRDAQFSVENSENEDPKAPIPEDFDASDTESNKLEESRPEGILDDSDDEELKNQDLDLTDEEKEVKRQEAIVLKNLGNEEFKSSKYLESI